MDAAMMSHPVLEDRGKKRKEKRVRFIVSFFFATILAVVRLQNAVLWNCGNSLYN